MRKPLISVVLCTYNCDKFISDAIDSILTQTYDNFEFIIWDDGSTDNTRNVIMSYKDKRIRYVYHENTGLGMALRLACFEAKGDYIARMDSDDISLPNRFEKEVAYLEAHRDCVLVSSAVSYIDENGRSYGRSFPYTNDKIIKRHLLKANNLIVHPMAMIRREAYVAAGGYLPIRINEDSLFWSRLAKHGKIYNIPSVLGQYRVLPSSLDHSFNPYKPVLKEFLMKMINDEQILDTDIEQYNQLFIYSKGQVSNKEKGSKENKKNADAEVFLYRIISPILGVNASEKLISKLKEQIYKATHR